MNSYDRALAQVPRSGSGVSVTQESSIYRPDDPGTSWIADHYRRALHQDSAAAERLARYGAEQRALDTSATSGGEFVPPQHLQSLWASLARAGRAFADMHLSRPLPDVGMSLTIPKVTSGSTTAVQATQNSATSNTDPATDELTLPVATIAGHVDLSTQAFERSTPGLDEVVLADLASDYNQKLDLQLLNGSGASGQVQGILQNSNIESVTYTDASPSVKALYPKLAEGLNRVSTLRFAAPEAIVMHPRRWAWILSALDTTDRPLVVPVAGQNAVARFSAVAAESLVGELLGLPVILDPNIPTTLGAGTNEDVIILTRPSDHYMAERGPELRVFDSPGSANLTVRLRVHGYLSFTSDRYGKATAKLTGTGLANPF